MSKPRIAIFDDWLPFHVGINQDAPEENNPIKWNEFMMAPNFELTYDDGKEKSYRLTDERAISEVLRLLKYKTCPICRTNMDIKEQEFNETILVCLSCGFWGGRGSRMDNVYEKIPLRGVLGIYRPLSPIKDIDTQNLVMELKRNPSAMNKISPQRAEKFVVDLIGDYLDCEVKPIGGTKDGGVDGYIIKNNKIKSIIQVKWRESTKGAESVSVIREVAGTLLARGVPSGILVSNRDHFSPDAKADANEVSKRKLNGLGRMKLTLYDYHNILDMLDFSHVKLTDRMSLKDWYKIENAYEVFEGAAKLHSDFVNMFKS